MQNDPSLREMNPLTCDSVFESIADAAMMSDAAFEAAYRTAKRFAADPAADIEKLTTVAEAAVAAFNAGAVRRSARLFALASAWGQAETDEPHEGDDMVVASSDQLNVQLFVECVNDPKRHADIVPLLNFFPDLRVPSLLDQLGKERRLARCEFIMNMVGIHGTPAVVPVLNMLDWPEIQQHDPRLLACLFAIVSRFRGLDYDDRRRAANLAGRYVAHESTQVRSAALAALCHIGGREALGPALKALKVSTYSSSGLAPVELLPQLAVALDLLAASGDEAAHMMVAEIAVGTRGAEFKLGRKLESLAVASLRNYGVPLGSKAVRIVAERLMEIASNRLRLVTGRLVQKVMRRSEAEHWAALFLLVVDSPDPKARRVQEHEGLRSLVDGLGTPAATPCDEGSRVAADRTRAIRGQTVPTFDRATL